MEKKQKGGGRTKSLLLCKISLRRCGEALLLKKRTQLKAIWRKKYSVDEKFWKQQPQFDFLPKKVQVKFGENTPSRAIQDIDGKIADEPE